MSKTTLPEMGSTRRPEGVHFPILYVDILLYPDKPQQGNRFSTDTFKIINGVGKLPRRVQRYSVDVEEVGKMEAQKDQKNDVDRGISSYAIIHRLHHVLIWCSIFPFDDRGRNPAVVAGRWKTCQNKLQGVYRKWFNYLSSPRSASAQSARLP